MALQTLEFEKIDNTEDSHYQAVTLLGGGEEVRLPALNGVETLPVDLGPEDLLPFILKQKLFSGKDVSDELIYSFIEAMVSQVMIDREVYIIENFYTIYKEEIRNLYDDYHCTESVQQNILLHQYNCQLNDAIFKIVNRYFNFKDNPHYITQVRQQANVLVSNLFIENAVSNLETALLDINCRLDNIKLRYCEK